MQGRFWLGALQCSGAMSTGLIGCAVCTKLGDLSSLQSCSALSCTSYSHLFNKRGAWNKRGGWNFLEKTST